MKIKKISALIIGLIILSSSIFADEKKTQVELSLSLNWTLGCYKETTFSVHTSYVGGFRRHIRRRIA